MEHLISPPNARGETDNISIDCLHFRLLAFAVEHEGRMEGPKLLHNSTYFEPMVPERQPGSRLVCYRRFTHTSLTGSGWQ